MFSPKLSTLLRLGYDDVAWTAAAAETLMYDEPGLHGLRLQDLRHIVRDQSRSLSEQDRVLAGVVRCYRRGPADLWSPILLELLAPALVRIASSLRPLAVWVAEDDIDQQVVVSLLEVANSMPLPDPPTYIERRLTLRVLTLLLRWLRSTARFQSDERNVASRRATDQYCQESALFELVDLAREDQGRASLELVYRNLVRKETFAEIARTKSLTPNAVAKRQRRAVRSLQRRTA